MSTLGNTLFIVNPASQNGNAARGAATIRYAARQYPMMVDSVEIICTDYPQHAVELAAHAAHFDTVVALGGDGILHEVVLGLMEIPRDKRPVLGLIPCGNGNDYARTLGMSFDLDSAFAQLAHAHIEAFDVGVCNGEYFVETVSFGLDAAIAIGTHARRERTGATGTELFVREGLDQLIHHRDIYNVYISFDDKPAQRYALHLCAIQQGATYGGGFKICPEADPCDGVFNVCFAHAPLGFARAAFIFLRAKNGKHTSYTKELSFMKAHKLRLEFEQEPPAQIDGEVLAGKTFEFTNLRKELRVMVP